ncbi:MAG: SocA family protein [Proteobacteria bacterium]|nr:SocA family protein [Pseudomonadota bacterium]
MDECDAPPFDALGIANAILDIAEEQNVGLTPLKLQKLLYFSHANFLVCHDGPLVSEQFEAWSMGPVNKRLFRAFRDYGSNRIVSRAKSFNPHTLKEREVALQLSPKVQLFLQEIFSFYGRLSAYQLSQISHETGSAWDQVKREGELKINVGLKIQNRAIKESYLKSHLPLSSIH